MLRSQRRAGAPAVSAVRLLRQRRQSGDRDGSERRQAVHCQPRQPWRFILHLLLQRGSVLHAREHQIGVAARADGRERDESVLDRPRHQRCVDVLVPDDADDDVREWPSTATARTSTGPRNESMAWPKERRGERALPRRAPRVPLGQRGRARTGAITLASMGQPLTSMSWLPGAGSVPRSRLAVGCGRPDRASAAPLLPHSKFRTYREPSPDLTTARVDGSRSSLSASRAGVSATKCV